MPLRRSWPAEPHAAPPAPRGPAEAPGQCAEWDLWSDWHASTSRSTGFSELGAPPTPAEPRLHQAYRGALPVYHDLVRDALGRG